MRTRSLILFVLLAGVAGAKTKDKHKQAVSPIDEYIAQAEARTSAPGQPSSPGSLFTPTGYLANTSRDLRASQIDDVITVLVSDRASALSKGVSNSSRKSSAKYGLTAAGGPLKAAGPWANLAGATGDSQLQGQGETSRENALTTTLTARVSHVLPNGNLVVEGSKNVVVNSESQLVRVRGIIRPSDVSPSNTIASDRLANLDIQINGRGVVGDAIKRPFILYRILMGILPF